jgi:hypothetical protein
MTSPLITTFIILSCIAWTLNLWVLIRDCTDGYRASFVEAFLSVAIAVYAWIILVFFS